jgi:hypothetical protein
MAGLWSGLANALDDLDHLAANPASTLASEGAVEELGGLQYSLHRALELQAGLEPPTFAAEAHAELAGALADARDATAEIAFLLEADGTDAVEPFVYEWRGALFRVRLARLRLARPHEPNGAVELDSRFPWRALMAVALVITGALALAGGAVLGTWAISAAGLAAFAAGALAYRP